MWEFSIARIVLISFESFFNPVVKNCAKELLPVSRYTSTVFNVQLRSGKKV